jgi:hypothetical protein
MKKGTFICGRKSTLRQFFTSWLAPQQMTVGGKDLSRLSYTLEAVTDPLSASSGPTTDPRDLGASEKRA